MWNPYCYKRFGIEGRENMYDVKCDNIMYFSANATMPSNTSGGALYKNISLGLMIDTAKGDILDGNINLVNPLANYFIVEQLRGCNILDDWDLMLNRLDRFQAPAHKAVVVALKTIKDRYMNVIKKG